ncbi:MAG: GHKL domain-containing protein [Deltaproteobacteria bacterium]|nr:GHKL domain-containing protein [Deltaproteobacteria bacterium]
MENSKEITEPTDFDMEYKIDQLLPVTVLDDIFRQVRKITMLSVAVLLPDGNCFHGKEALSQIEAGSLKAVLTRDKIESAKVYGFEKGRVTLVLPISHELETLGYLVFSRVDGKGPSDASLIPLGQLVLYVLDRLIYYNYKYLLTSNLHGQVIETSFEQLKEKAALLEESEKKYRALAESLEKEVEKKASKIKETQAQLMQQEKMASIGQLAAGVAHEINNPTGFVNSNLTTLSEYQQDIKDLIGEYRGLMDDLKEFAGSGALPPSITDKLDRISAIEKDADMDFILSDISDLIRESRDGVERIKNIVIDLKDFAHPGEDQMQAADINKGIESTLNVVWNELKYKAAVKKDFGALPLVNCYPQQLNQVFMNILINAAQAIEEHGEIKIATEAKDGFVMVRISDNGVGIPGENISKIFDPFFTTKAVGKGTGLGMNVAYNIIKKHKGQIDVESTVGKGTTFTVKIPG